MSYNSGPPYPSSSPNHGGYPPLPQEKNNYSQPPAMNQGYALQPGMPQPSPVGLESYSMPTVHSQPQPQLSRPPDYSPYPPNQQGYHPVQLAPPGTIISQPQNTGNNRAGEWMSIPRGIPNCPPGLEYLSSLDHLLVKQKVELLEAFTGFETNNKYTIKNNFGQKIYWAVEENDCCTRNCCGPARPFDMKIMDMYQNEIIHLYRPLACSSFCFPCCLQSMEVSSPPGNVVGRIEQEWTFCYPHFSIKNQIGETILRIKGPLCTFSCCGDDVDFRIVTMSGQEVGKISKKWSGLSREFFTDADVFGINFPMDLDVKMKAVMLGACFLIDMMFFERTD